MSPTPSPQVPDSPSASPAHRNERIAFHVALGLAVALLLGVFWPFRYVLTLAAMIAIVSRPVFERTSHWLGGRRRIAAVLTTLGLLLAVLAPVALLIQSATNEIRPALERVRLAAADSGAVERLGRELDGVRQQLPWMEGVLPRDRPTADAIQQMLADSIDRLLTWVSGAAPDLVGGLLGAGLHVLVFVLAVASLLADGPDVTRFLAKLSPLAPATTERLFSVFRHFAHNVIVASIVTAFVQGVIAAVGYRIVGADRVLLLGMLTMIGGFVPIVGTTIVWIPAAAIAYVEQGPGAAAFLVIWSLLATTSVDNFVRPFLVRGGSGIHPFLVFLGIFGGMAWMGFPGLLMGPVIVAMFLALAHLRIDVPSAEPPSEVRADAAI